ncbi:MAG: hypothetical protein BZY80_00475 [SAR202 cluster bacterium Io17-Chloro-G2]|nr:MAG: hypothetical protein BZY80_00475 [SAR202 cluster bacterium Io17-Chloro-G2]
MHPIDQDKTSLAAPVKNGASLGRGPRIRTFSSLRSKDFRLLWVGNVFEHMALWLQLISLSWLVWSLSESALQSGLAAGLRGLPTLVIGPWAGVIADRMDRRQLVMGAQVIHTGLSIVFAILVASGTVQVWHAMLYAIVSGVCFGFIMPARQALIVNTVPPEDRGNAFALSAMTVTSNRLIGGILGGLLITTVGIQWNFFVEGAAYLVTGLLLIPMRTPYREVSTARQSSVLTNLKDGLSYVWKDNRIILHLMVMNFVLNMAFIPIPALLPAYTTAVLQSEANVGGYLLAAQGVGGVTATVLLASLGFFRKKGLLTMLALLIGSTAILTLAQSHWLLLSLAMLIVLGICQTTFIVTNQVLVQAMVPDDLRGRVTSLYMLEFGLGPVAILFIGLLMDLYSVSGALTMVASASLAAALCFLLVFRRVRDLE